MSLKHFLGVDFILKYNPFKIFKSSKNTIFENIDEQTKFSKKLRTKRLVDLLLCNSFLKHLKLEFNNFMVNQSKIIAVIYS